MNILTLNVGSSSLKYALYKNTTCLTKGTIERLQEKITIPQALAKVNNTIKAYHIDAIAHRVVHGGDIRNHTKITPATIKKIEKAKHLAPLHDPNELRVIKWCYKKYDCPQFAIMDSAFHGKLQDRIREYALPKSITKKLKIERYGFHGISLHYISQKLKNPKNTIICHLGGGSSISATHKGKVLDTSMGFTPLEGPIMGTRPGSFDPGILLYMVQQGMTSHNTLAKLLYTKSGTKAICGLSDMRDIIKSKRKDAKLAYEMYCLSIAKFIAATSLSLNKLDTIVFTGGIGENEWHVRKRVCELLHPFIIKLSAKNNRSNNNIISTPASKVKIIIEHTNESLMMAKITRDLLRI